MSDTALREHLSRALDWGDSHATFDAAVESVPARVRGVKPEGLPYSLWQLVEHLRIAQHDILDFCRNPQYQELNWPDDYWPKSPAPPSDGAWDESIARYRADRDALKALAMEADLFATIPHGSGQTYLREILLAADHGAYHTGEIVLVRRLLGVWPA